jgi:hypothetical protein
MIPEHALLALAPDEERRCLARDGWMDHRCALLPGCNETRYTSVTVLAV